MTRFSLVRSQNPRLLHEESIFQYVVSIALTIFLLLTSVSSEMAGADLRPITVEDCVKTKRIVNQEVQVSPDGSRVAYVVKAPDLNANRNDYQLRVRDLKQGKERENGRLVLQADNISGLRWLGPAQVVAHVESKPGSAKALESGLYMVNVATGALERLRFPTGIEQFSASADGETFVFSEKAIEDKARAEIDRDEEKSRERRGFPIVFGEGDPKTYDQPREDVIYLAKKTGTGSFAVKKLYFVESDVSPEQSTLRRVSWLDLSPDGKHLLVVYSDRTLPPGWEQEAYIRYTRGLGSLFETYVLSLYDVESGRMRLGFNFSGTLLHTRWSDDSRSYCVIGPSPFGTDEARVEAKEAAASGNILNYMLQFQHVFTVDVQTGTIARVMRRVGDRPGNISFWEDLPLTWKHSDGPMLVRADDNTIVWTALENREWKETARFDLSSNNSFFSSLASDGRFLVAVSQTTMVPPDLLALDLKTKTTILLTDLNPEYQHIRLGEVERIEWTNGYGSNCAGLVIKPVGYEEGKRYPMILLSAPPQDVFISDAVYTTAYAPQSLANAGFVVVLAQYPLDNKIPPKTYPGEMSEAYNWMGMVESAVDLLASRGIVDKERIGIAGFSRTSWLTDFTLTHSAYHFVAASSADSGIYTYGSYFRFNSAEWMKGEEMEVGGPPYGDTFKYWLDYSPPFHADKVRAAVLMEYTETAELGFEFFTALARLGKPVEFFRYPDGSHPLDTPYERVASLQRNVDWFRFWMQGYEGTSVAYDANQYVRWRKLRKLQEQNQTTAPAN
jgi:dipeptidyl aminopeptidase/acylaminoacyl peptidase